MFLVGWLASSVSPAETVVVRHPEGLVRGFLVLRSLDGTALADGDLIQSAKGDRVTSRLVFRFRDGSLHDETAVFTQRGRFRLVSDHLVQRGPSFPEPIDVRIDAASGNVKIRYLDKGEEKSIEEREPLPEDLANGLMLVLVKNIAADAPSTSVSALAATPKPRKVKYVVTPAGEDPFSVGGASHKATRFRVKVEIGGMAGLIAPIIGKQPPDTFVWILGGEAPGFVRSEGPLYQDGPIWRIELARPDYPEMRVERRGNPAPASAGHPER
jgi:hypothetical protein